MLAPLQMFTQRCVTLRSRAPRTTALRGAAPARQCAERVNSLPERPGLTWGRSWFTCPPAAGPDGFWTVLWHVLRVVCPSLLPGPGTCGKHGHSTGHLAPERRSVTSASCTPCPRPALRGLARRADAHGRLMPPFTQHRPSVGGEGMTLRHRAPGGQPAWRVAGRGPSLAQTDRRGRVAQSHSGLTARVVLGNVRGWSRVRRFDPGSCTDSGGRRQGPV